MTAQEPAGPEHDQTLEIELQRLRELYADAPEVGKRALNALPKLVSQASATPGLRTKSAGRAGSRLGKVSELTVIAPFAPGGARRLRALLEMLQGVFDAGEVGTVHDMRFAFIDNDTRLLFASTYDGDWDGYLHDFALKIPDSLDLIFSASEGWPGIRSPAAKDWIAERQVTAQGWFVAHPNLTVVDTQRLRDVGKAVEQLLDRVE